MAACSDCGCKKCKCKPCTPAKGTKPFDGSTFEILFSGLAQGGSTSFLSNIQGVAGLNLDPLEFHLNFDRQAVSLTAQSQIALLAGQSLAVNLLKNGEVVGTVTLTGPLDASTPVTTTIAVPFLATDDLDVQVVPTGSFDPQVEFGVIASLALTTDPEDANPPKPCKPCKNCGCEH